MKIYRNWEHYWREGVHGFSSASREEAKAIWDDIEPTIMASRDDYKNTFVQLMTEYTERRKDITDALLEYIDKFSKDRAPKFFRWYLDNKLENK